jgi:hypothetical protein
MKKLITMVLLASGFMCLSSCDSKNSLEVGVPVTINYLTESTRRSCAIMKGEAANPPDQPAGNDIESAYFQLDRVNFKWSDPNSNLLIRKITITFPGGEIPTCTLTGVDLISLYDNWYKEEEALVGGMTMMEIDGVTPRLIQPTTTIAADCPVICGGIPATQKFQATGILEVKGVQVDKLGNALNYPSASITTAITIINE